MFPGDVVDAAVLLAALSLRLLGLMGSKADVAPELILFFAPSVADDVDLSDDTTALETSVDCMVGSVDEASFPFTFCGEVVVSEFLADTEGEGPHLDLFLSRVASAISTSLTDMPLTLPAALFVVSLGRSLSLSDTADVVGTVSLAASAVFSLADGSDVAFWPTADFAV